MNDNGGFWGAVQKDATARKEPFFILAPMADVTDVPFRTIVARCGRPDVFYTEFVSAHGLASSGRDVLMRDLALTDADHPIVAQFFGTVPEHLFAAGKLARELGFDGVDINMGCPDRGIMKQGAGIALIRQPSLAKDLIAALRDGAGGLPVAVKTRLGLYDTDEMEPWITALLEAVPDVLTIHGRTMKEASAVPAHWDLIGRAAQMCREAGVLCIGNGDVTSCERGIALAQQYGVDGIMVGRGIFHDPWFFGAGAGHEHAPRERLKLLREHIELWLRQWGGHLPSSRQVKSFALMKKFFKMYVSGWPGAGELRAALMETTDAVSAQRVITDTLAEMTQKAAPVFMPG